MNNKRTINGVILFFIIMLVFIGIYDVSNMDILDSLVVAGRSMLIAYVLEHITTTNIIKQYDEMKCVNGGATTGVGVLVKALSLLAIIGDIGIVLTEGGGPRDYSMPMICFILVLVSIDMMTVYIGNKYIIFQNRFIKIEDITNFTQGHIVKKNGNTSSKIEVIIEIKQGKKYRAVFTELAGHDIKNLEDILENKKLEA